MGLQNDGWIRDMAKEGMISPFVEQTRTALNGTKIISAGISSYGYDMRVGEHFRVFTNFWPGIIDPKDFTNSATWHDVHAKDGYVVIPPNSFALAQSVEYFKIPRDVLTICLGKSTYARCGIIVNVTAFEPEWEGNVTIEISNTTPLPAKVYANEGIAQILFFIADETCQVSYADKKGKYQGQTGITIAKV